MIDAAALRHPVSLLVLAALLAGCAGPRLPPPPVQVSGSPHYACPNGSGFAKQFDPDTHQLDLFLTGGAAHRLDPVPDPMGGVLYEDADYQLRPSASDVTAALTDRSTTARQNCTRSP